MEGRGGGWVGRGDGKDRGMGERGGMGNGWMGDGMMGGREGK